MSRSSYLIFFGSVLSSIDGFFGHGGFGVNARHSFKLSSTDGSLYWSSSRMGDAGIFWISVSSDGSIFYFFIHSSMISIKQHVSSMVGAFRNCDKMNSIFSSPISKVIFPHFTSIMALTVARKDLPRIIGMLEYYLMYIIIKSIGMKN